MAIWNAFSGWPTLMDGNLYGFKHQHVDKLICFRTVMGFELPYMDGKHLWMEN